TAHNDSGIGAANEGSAFLRISNFIRFVQHCAPHVFTYDFPRGDSPTSIMIQNGSRRKFINYDRATPRRARTARVVANRTCLESRIIAADGETSGRGIWTPCIRRCAYQVTESSRGRRRRVHRGERRRSGSAIKEISKETHLIG